MISSHRREGEGREGREGRGEMGGEGGLGLGKGRSWRGGAGGEELEGKQIESYVVVGALDH